MTRTSLITGSIRPFRLRLTLFAALRAFLAALTAGGFVFSAVTLGSKIAEREADGEKIVWFAAGAAAVVTLIAVFLVFLPSRTETARQIDALGLKDRTLSMLALRDYPFEIADLQREDALRHLGTVKASRLRVKIGALSVVLVLIALLTAAASVLVPSSWFARERDGMGETWEQVMEMLREERDRLAEAGENRLAGEMDELIRELENTDSILRAVGEISDAEEGVKDAAREGDASRGAMNEALDVLEEARRLLLGEEEPPEEEGEGTEGEEMLLVPGEGEQGMEGPGDFPGEGEVPGGEPGGNEDGSGRGSGEEGGEERLSRMTEPVYDPISGTVPYGEVFSAYYSDYLRDAQNGGIPYEVSGAARSYFEDLDR